MKPGDRVTRTRGSNVVGESGRVLEIGPALVVKLDSGRTISAPATHWRREETPRSEHRGVASAVKVRTVISDLFGGNARVRGVR